MSQTPEGHVYVAQADSGPVKIGISRAPLARLADLERSSGRRFVRTFISHRIGEPAAIERQLHGLFARARGVGEWFDVPFDDVVGAAHLLLAPTVGPAQERSALVVRAIGLLDRYRKMLAAHPGSEAHLEGFLLAICGDDESAMDDLDALAVTVMGLAISQALEAEEMIGAVLPHLPEGGAAKLAATLRGSMWQADIERVSAMMKNPES